MTALNRYQFFFVQSLLFLFWSILPITATALEAKGFSVLPVLALAVLLVAANFLAFVARMQDIHKRTSSACLAAFLCLILAPVGLIYSLLAPPLWWVLTSNSDRVLSVSSRVKTTYH